MSNVNENIISFVKKGFLLDKESLDFLNKLEDLNVAEEILNKIFLITKARIISKKVLNEHFKEIKSHLQSFGAEKQEIISNFFDSAKKTSLPEIRVEVKDPSKLSSVAYHPEIKILSSNIIPHKRIEVKDFVTHFKNRYNFFKEILRTRKELENLISVNKVGNNRTFSIIGLVSNKRVTKNKNIILEIEDLTGKINVLIGADKENVVKKAKEVVLDDVIGIKCSGGRELIYASDIIFPESFSIEKRKTEEEVYAVFISDIHIGSKLFLEEKFARFIKWLRGEEVDESMREKIKKIKYLFVCGDNVDGIGVYPSQESLLTIKDVREQYAKLADYFKMIPSYINIIVCPGQHDAVRVPEPQPAVDETFAKALIEMKNVFLVSNPALIEIESKGLKKGVKVMMYHGASMHSWIDEIEELRTGQANLNPSKVVKFMLRHRHLSPMHSSNVYVPSEKEDMLIVKEIPDIMVTGDMHRTDVDIYNNILIICCSCWQSITPFEEKVGNQPDPAKVPFLNLKTREIKILDFN